MAATPSSRRRAGRNAFSPGEDPLRACPYKSWNNAPSSYQRDWLEGWMEAKASYLSALEEKNAGSDGVCPRCGVRNYQTTPESDCWSCLKPLYPTKTDREWIIELFETVADLKRRIEELEL